jgi:chromatin segregation and condensation protein Rec8/ScpA/Scc1 (kleisin family)
VIAAFPDVELWAVGGHSLGGAMAANFARKNPEQVRGLVLWAAYPAASDDLSSDQLAAVSIYGTRDGLATLEEIDASRLLLPRDESNPEEADPREELIMALIEYKKYREASEILREKALMEERNYVPDLPVGEVKTKIDVAPGTSLFDLISAFKEVLEARRDEAFHDVDTTRVSIEERITVVMSMLAEKEFATFQELFADVPRRIIAVMTFIALLELVRSRRVKIHQSVPFRELRVYRGDQFSAPRQEIDLVDYTETNTQAVG